MFKKIISYFLSFFYNQEIELSEKEKKQKRVDRLHSAYRYHLKELEKTIINSLCDNYSDEEIIVKLLENAQNYNI